MYVNAYRGIIICRMPDMLQRKREKKMDITELIGKLDEISASGDHELYMKTITEYISSYDSEHPEDLNGRSVLYNELGAHLRQTGTEDLGKKAFESAAEMLEKLLEENPGDHTITMNLATTVNNLAGAYRLRKEYEKALAAFDRSMEIYKSLKDVPDNLFPSVWIWEKGRKQRNVLTPRFRWSKERVTQGAPRYGIWALLITEWVNMKSRPRCIVKPHPVLRKTGVRKNCIKTA